MVRHYIQLLLKSDPVVNEVSINEMRYKQILGQSARLRFNGCFSCYESLFTGHSSLATGNMINEKAFARRKAYLIQKKTGMISIFG